MKTKRHSFARVVMQLSAMVLGSGCILEMIGEPAVTREIIVITATGEKATEGRPTASPTTEVIETSAPTPTFTPTLTLTLTPTSTATATPTTAPVTMTAGQTLSCVKGPHWILFEWVTSIPEGEIVTLLARSTSDWPDYFYVRKSDGKECWAFGGSSVTSGNIYSLPEKEAPPLPTITYKIQNLTNLPIFNVYLREKDGTNWGTDRLGGSHVNRNGTFNITLTAGFFDVLMKDSLGGILFEKYDTPIGPEPSSSNIVFNSRYAKAFRNNTVHAICRIEGNPLPGDIIETMSIPGDGKISPGEEVAVEALAGFYDVFGYRCGDNVNVFALGSVYFGPKPVPTLIIT